MFRGIWDKITMVVAIPVGLAFVVLAIFGQLCLDKLPYLAPLRRHEKFAITKDSIILKNFGELKIK